MFIGLKELVLERVMKLIELESLGFINSFYLNYLGSTQQSWNVEQALLKQKSEEEHVTVLLQVSDKKISKYFFKLNYISFI